MQNESESNNLSKLDLSSHQYETLSTYITFLCDDLLIPPSLIQLSSKLISEPRILARMVTAPDRAVGIMHIGKALLDSDDIATIKVTLIHELLHFKFKDIASCAERIIDERMKPSQPVAKVLKGSLVSEEEKLVDELAHAFYHLVDDRLDIMLASL